MAARGEIVARLTRADASSLVVEVAGPMGTRALEYLSPDPVWPAPPPTLDFAAVALAQFAASEGCDLHLDGPVTRAQLERLEEYLAIWSVWRPRRFEAVRITAGQETELPDVADRGGAVMGFSGGVDASFALAAHSTGILGRMSRPVDLGVLVVGWDLRHGDDEALSRARASAERSLAEYGANVAVVSTNWQQDFCNAWFRSFGSGLLSVLHTFSGEHSAAILGTDVDYRQELSMPPYGSHMMVNHLLGNPWFPVVSTGGTHRRVDRVGFLRDHPTLLHGLRVCYQADAQGSNCGHCTKCVRTQLELRVNGLTSDEAFPVSMTVGDLRRATKNSPVALYFFEDILARMRPDDELRQPLEEWLRDHRGGRRRGKGAAAS